MELPTSITRRLIAVYIYDAHSSPKIQNSFQVLLPEILKKFRKNSNFVLPDRSVITMDRHFLKSYVNLLVQTCHKRRAHAMGGMAAQIPIKNDPIANEKALSKVKDDKEREAKAGHDGTWIAHPGLAPIALGAFDKVMPDSNQIKNLREDVNIPQSYAVIQTK